nr:hypothetical protein [Tanacetum cinerariifolium]
GNKCVLRCEVALDFCSEVGDNEQYQVLFIRGKQYTQVGTPSTGSRNLYCQWELSPGSGNALCILFPTRVNDVHVSAAMYLLLLLVTIKTAKVKSLMEKDGLGAQEDASKQGRMIEEIDQNAEIALDDETQGRTNDDEMFGVDDLAGEEVVMETTTGVKDSVALTTDVIEDEVTMAQALAALKSTKPKVVVQEQKMSTTIPAAATIVTTVVPTLRAKAVMDADRLSAEKLQEREKEEFLEVQKARLLVELIEKRKKHFVALRAQEKRNKPPTKTQMKSQMSTHLKHMGGYKQSHLKGRSFDQIKKLFDREMTKVNDFIAMDSEAQESSTKRTTKYLESDISKKQKEGKKTYFKIIRVDGNSEVYQTFEKMLKNFNREDLEVLWDIVKDRFKKEKPVDEMDNLLFRTLKNMFEHHVEDTIWKYQQRLAKVKNWKPFESCGVYCITMQSTIYYLLVEKVYPLTRNTPHQLWSDVRLQVDYDVEMAYDLLRFIKKQLMEGEYFECHGRKGEEVNDRKIGKLCKYAERNPLSLPKIQHAHSCSNPGIVDRINNLTQPPLRKKAISQVIKCSNNQTSGRQLVKLNTVEGEIAKKASKTEHHLWNKRDSAASGQKALNLVRIVCGLPNEKEAVYGELDKWTAWESEFPVIAVAKALNILKQRKQWKRVIQVAKWMFGKGQGMTMGTFDTLLLAFDMNQRVDEAQSFWNMILLTHERSISKRLFSRMISIYAHHNMPENIIEVFADMEELGVKPDEDTARKVARAFQKVGEKEKQNLVLKKSYALSWKSCQGDTLNLHDHSIRRRCCSLIPAESDSLPNAHAHAQTTKTNYKHQDSRIKKAQDLKTKTSANSDIQDLPLRYQVYQGRLLASIQDDAKYEHVGQDTRSQGGPYPIFTVVLLAVPATENSPAVPEHTTVETLQTMSPENKAHYESEKEAIHLILIGIGDEIYSTVDACKTAQEMWEAIERLQQGESLNIQDVKTNLFWVFGKFTSRGGETMESYYTRFYKMMNEMIRNNLKVATMQVNVQFLQQLQPEWSRFVTFIKQQHKLDEVSYHKLFDILKQYQKEVNELRAERIARNSNPLALVATAQSNQDPYYQTPKSHKPYAPTSKASIPTRSHATTINKSKEIAKPITPPSESASEEDSNPEQAQRDKAMQKKLAFIAKYFKKIYKPTNNNLITSSNPRNKNVDTTLRYRNDNQSAQFGNQRAIIVARARENVGSPVVQQTRIQCFNCKDIGHFAKECRKPKRVKDFTCHKENMLLWKQAEQGVPLQAEQSDWLADTDDEIDEQKLEAHYSFMAKIQEVVSP